MVSQLSTIGSDTACTSIAAAVPSSSRQARQIFRDLIDMPAEVTSTEREIEVRFHRRTH